MNLQKSDLQESKTFKEIADNITGSQKYPDLLNRKSYDVELAERELFNIKKKEIRKQPQRAEGRRPTQQIYHRRFLH